MSLWPTSQLSIDIHLSMGQGRSSIFGRLWRTDDRPLMSLVASLGIESIVVVMDDTHETWSWCYVILLML
jgi:hypothetical protein